MTSFFLLKFQFILTGFVVYLLHVGRMMKAMMSRTKVKYTYDCHIIIIINYAAESLQGVWYCAMNNQFSSPQFSLECISLTVSEIGKLSVCLHSWDSISSDQGNIAWKWPTILRKGNIKVNFFLPLNVPLFCDVWLSPSLCIVNIKLVNKLKLYKELPPTYTCEAIKLTNLKIIIMVTLKAIVKDKTDQFAKLVKGMISYHTSCIFLIYILCIK